MPQQESKTPIEIKVIWTQGCRHTMQTIEHIEDTAEEMGIALKLETILVSSLEEAREQKLQGSPTVLINGLDIDPARRLTNEYGFT
jgi:hypothetical protein